LRHEIIAEELMKEVWIGCADIYPDGTTYIQYSIAGETHHIGFPNRQHFVEYLYWLESMFIVVNVPIVKILGGDILDIEDLR